MRILHLTIGIPPYRSGGLPNYAYSLANEEIQLGYDVFLLYPGNIDLLLRKTRITISKGSWNRNLNVYKIVNPNYVAIPLGIRNPETIVCDGPKDVYSEFLDMIKPDLIHVHTLMGFHKELFSEIKERAIQCLYTTHDYYPICPRTSLVRNDNTLCVGFDPENCCVCNMNAVYSLPMQYILQSGWYPHIKNIKIVAALKKHRSTNDKKVLKEKYRNQTSAISHSSIEIESYRKLWSYHQEILSAITIIHCNSTITENIYKSIIGKKRHFVLNITTDGIIDNRRNSHRLHFENENLIHIGFIGIRDYHKGAWLLLEAGRILREFNQRFRVLLYGDEFDIPMECSSFCESRGSFSHDRISEVMREIDIMVVPAFWYETFGFAVLEAIANGIPVIVSSHTGGKDLLNSIEMPHVFEPNPQQLANLLSYYLSDTDKLLSLRKEQNDLTPCFDMKEHAIELFEKIAELT